jgi:hypothetical protein
LGTNVLCYRWTETGTLNHYRHALAFAPIAGRGVLQSGSESAEGERDQAVRSERMCLLTSGLWCLNTADDAHSPDLEEVP